MRSACWGAMSVRNLMMIRPFVVSITMAFFLSRLAGSGCAIAGAIKASVARTARIRIMETPVRWRMRTSGILAGEFGFEVGLDQLRHEGRDIAAHLGDLAHQCGGDRA